MFQQEAQDVEKSCVNRFGPSQSPTFPETATTALSATVPIMTAVVTVRSTCQRPVLFRHVPRNTNGEGWGLVGHPFQSGPDGCYLQFANLRRVLTNRSCLPAHNVGTQSSACGFESHIGIREARSKAKQACVHACFESTIRISTAFGLYGITRLSSAKGRPVKQYHPPGRAQAPIEKHPKTWQWAANEHDKGGETLSTMVEHEYSTTASYHCSIISYCCR